MSRDNSVSKLRREKAPKEGYNFLRFVDKFTLQELERYLFRQLYDPVEQTDVARREKP
jgi:exonuclease I